MNDKPHHAEKFTWCELNESRGKKRNRSGWDLKEDATGDSWESVSNINNLFPKRRRLRRPPVHRPVPWSIEDLQEIYKIINHLQEEMLELQAQDWDYKRKY